MFFRSPCTNFAALFQKESFRDVVQLVVYLVWDQGVARSSRVIPTKKGEKRVIDYNIIRFSLLLMFTYLPKNYETLLFFDVFIFSDLF